MQENHSYLIRYTIMKQVLFGTCLLGSLVSQIFAQEVKIKAIPYVMHCENAPVNYVLTGDNSIEIIANAGTELFIPPGRDKGKNNSPRLLFKPDSVFILTSKIALEFKSNWDAGVLLVYNDEKHYAKFCFERDYQGQPRVVTVVCNESCDDCNSITIDKQEVYFRIIGSGTKNTFDFYYSSDAKSWYRIRSFKLDKSDNINIGFSAQSPKGQECKVNFSNIDLQQRKPIDRWQGN